ncbi:probable bifunctional methylthioribulose-1-phosphate dehydratase/enolase-phosphatase E1 2 isoform X2 [Malania oleifera]|uniref:probable bifunctional methylthioribulose-1-phosphate dehydratase/enolase-phosphatase E1 2 isoform X2 n=1 Tax=Malania oleifera TaxID=397392 RepID=UPI0025ADFBFD|nr:probable bifunctional methylthioribulose-1-phosphate dehydratase/enolase-phosphatase E1 2 isoform X2 [Malania oleifera]
MVLSRFQRMVMGVEDGHEHLEQNKMLPPPVGVFPTREELLKHVRDFALTQGYMVSIKDSSKDRYVTIACDRGGIYRRRLKNGENMRRRKTPTRLTNCPFEIVGKKDYDSWTLTLKHGEHNHGPSKDISDHPSCCCFTEEEVLIIREMTATGKRPCQILKALRQRNPNLVSDSRNVYNVKAKIRREISSGKMQSLSSSSAGMNGATTSQPTMPNGVAVTVSSPTYLESQNVRDTRALVADLCRHFYSLGWLSGTGGSITVKVHDDSIPKSCQLIVMSPSGVQKERMVPEDMYVLSSEGFILSTPPLKPYPHHPPKSTDCAPLFLKVYEKCNAGAVIHSHGLESCLVTMVHPLSKEFRIKSYPKTMAVLVQNHGVYLWGDSWISAKTQAECYHYLFNAAIKLHELGLDWSSPSHGPLHSVKRFGGCNGHISRPLKMGPFGLDYVIKLSHRCILLNIEGTTTPMSFFTDVLVPYAHNNMVKHLAATFDGEETKDAINLLFSQIQEDLEQGAVGAVPIPSDYGTKDLVIASLAANVEAMIRTARKVTALKLLEVYVYSNCSREAQQLLLANSNFGDLRKYFCGFFDTTVGNKEENHSYSEILQSVGVVKPTDMVFVTDVFQEAVAAKAAGLEVMISIRAGNEPLPEHHGFRTIESLLQI